MREIVGSFHSKRALACIQALGEKDFHMNAGWLTQIMDTGAPPDWSMCKWAVDMAAFAWLTAF